MLSESTENNQKRKMVKATNHVGQGVVMAMLYMEVQYRND